MELDAQFRASKGRGDELRQQRNTISKEIGKLMSQGKKDEAQEVKKAGCRPSPASWRRWSARRRR